jgi:hypothetical protein
VRCHRRPSHLTHVPTSPNPYVGLSASVDVTQRGWSLTIEVDLLRPFSVRGKGTQRLTSYEIGQGLEAQTMG